MLDTLPPIMLVYLLLRVQWQPGALQYCRRAIIQLGTQFAERAQVGTEIAYPDVLSQRWSCGKILRDDTVVKDCSVIGMLDPDCRVLFKADTKI